jgi:N-acetylglucosaminyldiphosphoundecaprenol N-acetyl-beta-D-mannosaminyltransferase
MGAPRQEQWLAEHAADLAPRVRMGVGGLFDFYSGRIERAPVWMREIGLEWVYRLLQEPGRMWRRYIIGNPLFLFRVWKESRRTAHEATA